MLESEYLELVNQLKSKFDELEMKEKKLVIKHLHKSTAVTFFSQVIT